MATRFDFMCRQAKGQLLMRAVTTIVLSSILGYLSPCAALESKGERRAPTAPARSLHAVPEPFCGMMPPSEREKWWTLLEGEFPIPSGSDYFSVHGPNLIKGDRHYFTTAGKVGSITSRFGKMLDDLAANVGLDFYMGYPRTPLPVPDDKKARLADLLSAPYHPEHLSCRRDRTPGATIDVVTGPDRLPSYTITYHKGAVKDKPVAFPVGMVHPLYQERAITYSSEFRLPVEAKLELGMTHHPMFENNVTGPIKARDGADIHYLMYVPKDFYRNPSVPRPVVFMVYGGGSKPSFETEYRLSQERILANFGCIVVHLSEGELDTDQPEPDLKAANFRSNYSNFPRQLFEDIEDVYQALSRTRDEAGHLWDYPYLQRGLSTVVLSGGSFGGHVALKMATDPTFGTLFDGYYSFAGDFDLALNLQTGRRGLEAELKEHINRFDFSRATPQKCDQNTCYVTKNFLLDPEYNRTVSPVYHLANLKRPFLAIQGGMDEQVIPEQMDRLIEEATGCGKRSLIRPIFYPRVGHCDPEEFSTFRHMYESILEFIADLKD